MKWKNGMEAVKELNTAVKTKGDTREALAKLKAAMFADVKTKELVTDKSTFSHGIRRQHGNKQNL